MAEELRQTNTIQAGGVASEVAPAEVAAAPAPAPRVAQPTYIERMCQLYINAAAGFDAQVSKRFGNISPQQRTALEAPILGIIAKEAAIKSGVDLNVGNLLQEKDRDEAYRQRLEREKHPMGFGTHWR